jgi:hypothetical protein
MFSTCHRASGAQLCISQPLFVAPPRNTQNKMQGAETQGQEPSPRPAASAAAVTSTASTVAAPTNTTTTTPIPATRNPCHRRQSSCLVGSHRSFYLLRVRSRRSLTIRAACGLFVERFHIGHNHSALHVTTALLQRFARMSSMYCCFNIIARYPSE